MGKYIFKSWMFHGHVSHVSFFGVETCVAESSRDFAGCTKLRENRQNRYLKKISSFNSFTIVMWPEESILRLFQSIVYCVSCCGRYNPKEKRPDMFWPMAMDQCPQRLISSLFFVSLHTLPKLNSHFGAEKWPTKQPNRKKALGTSKSHHFFKVQLLVTTSGDGGGKKQCFVTLFFCRTFQESEATWTIPVLWWATDLVTLPAADHDDGTRNSHQLSILCRGWEALPWKRRCRGKKCRFFFHVVKSTKFAKFVSPTGDKDLFHVSSSCWSKWCFR